MSTNRSPFDYSGRSSESDYHLRLPRNTPTPGTTLRGAMDYKESVCVWIPANYDYTSSRSSISSCGSEEGDDDVFHERKDAFMVRELTPYPKALQRRVPTPYRAATLTTYPISYEDSNDDVSYERKNPFMVRELTPYPKALQRRVPTPYPAASLKAYPIRFEDSDVDASYERKDPFMVRELTPYPAASLKAYPIRFEESGDDVSYERKDPFMVREWTPNLKPVQGRVPTPLRVPMSTASMILYPISLDDSPNTGSGELSSYSLEGSGRFSADFTCEPLPVHESTPVKEASPYYSPADESSSDYSAHVARTTLPSWPDTPSPVHPRTRKSPYLRPFDKYDPSWDMETRHSEGGGYSPPDWYTNTY